MAEAVEPTADGVVRKIVPEKMPPELRPQGRDEQPSQVIPQGREAPHIHHHQGWTNLASPRTKLVQLEITVLTKVM